ncbi:unnamed protein product [Caenorhabditis auriculariae]|uniref:Uncharacterized protein n=1 Tax=Caenorhabditis auriculariae TaxID=2777116 RepID=A0A8S1GRR9_9PELO|nr:unnamed protein product [Caenorhabditis auriculariae]
MLPSSAFLIAALCALHVSAQSGNIYGYNYDSSSGGSGLSYVVNPNYRFLNNQLASEYAQTYQQESRAYDQNGGSSQNNFPGYYNGPPRTNDQQNQINYQDIQRDTGNNFATSTASSNIYGYNYGSGSSSGSGSNYVNPNNVYYSGSSSTAAPLYYPFGQYQANTNTNPSLNNVQRDQSNQQSSGGEGPMRGPTLASTRFFDPGNNKTEMYYPYRTSTNYNLPPTNNGNPSANQVFFNPSQSSSTSNIPNSGGCQSNDPYWCNEYVNIYLNAATTYNSVPRQQACRDLVSSLTESYNGCCNTETSQSQLKGRNTAGGSLRRTEGYAARQITRAIKRPREQRRLGSLPGQLSGNAFAVLRKCRFCTEFLLAPNSPISGTDIAMEVSGWINIFCRLRLFKMLEVEPLNVECKLSVLEAQLAHSNDKIAMRENVIMQLEEEIKTKERLIYEQSHLISILENEVPESKYDTDSIGSESEITIIEREVASSSSTSPCASEKSSSSSGRSDDRPCVDDCLRHCRCRGRLEQALLDRERLELQNEQLLKQWEEALEYVSSVQRQLQEELKRNTKHYIFDPEIDQESIVMSKCFLKFISVCAVLIAFYLYSI